MICCKSQVLNRPQLNRLQLVLNAIARTPTFRKIFPVLKSPHWLKMNERINCEIHSVTYTVIQTNNLRYRLGLYIGLFHLPIIAVPSFVLSVIILRRSSAPVLLNCLHAFGCAWLFLHNFIIKSRHSWSFFLLHSLYSQF